MADINGTSGDDELFGTSGDDAIQGNDGNDTLWGFAGNDDIQAGDGNDTVFGGDGEDNIQAGSGDDTVDAGDGNDVIDGGDGNDSIEGGGGDDEIDSGNGADTVFGGAGDDKIKAGNEDDIVSGGEGDDELDGGNDFDIAVFSGSILDFLWTGSSDDLTITDLNTANGDEGQDTLKDFEALQFDDFTFNLDGSNHAPLVVDDGPTTDEDSATSFDVSSYDFDGDTLSLDSFSITGSGSLTLNSSTALTPLMGTGTAFNFSFDPGAGYQSLAVGETVVEIATITVSDGNGGVTVHNIDVTITGVNDDPTMLAGVGAATEDGPTVDVDLSLLGDDVDSDNDGTNLIYSIIGILSEGGASISGNTLTFDPLGDFQDLAAGETRDVIVTVQAEDAHGATTTAEITITVTGTNDAPTMVGAVGAANEDGGPIFVDLAAFGADVDSDDDGTTLSYVITGAPTEGTASINGTDLTFDPGEDFQDLGVGETRDVTITVEITDSHGVTTTEEVTITVTGTNDAPVAQDTSLAATEGAGLIVIDLNALVTDVDVNDIHSISVVSIVDSTGRGVTIPLTIVDGIVTIDPAEFGLDETQIENFVLSFLADDGNGGTAIGEVTITVTGAAGDPTPPTNNAPVANDLEVTANEADGLILIDLNDLVSDADSDPLTITSVMLLDDGHATPVVFTVVNGVIQIDPAQFGLDEGESITQMFEFTVDDGSGATNSSTTGTVNLIIDGAPDAPPTNNAPVANDQVNAAVGESAGVFQIDLNTLISDPDAGDVLSISGISFSSNGVEISVNYTIAGGVVFIDPEQFGLDTGESFTGILSYVVDDGSGAANSSATGEVTFTVDGEDEVAGNNAPVTVDQSLSINLETIVGDFSFDLAGFAGDIDPLDILTFTDLSFTYTIVIDAEAGTTQTFNVVYTIVGTVVTFDPTQFGLLDGESLGVEFTYSVDDGSGASNSSTTGTVVVSIEDPLDTPPTAVGEYLLDFEPFANADDFAVDIANYEQFVFNGDAQVFETDEVDLFNGRDSGLPQGVFNGVVSGDNVLAMEADGSLSISGAGTGMEGVDNVGTFNLDSLYLTSSVTEGMTVTFTTFEEVFEPGVGMVLQEVGSFSFIVGTSGMGAGGTSGGNIFINFDDLIDPTTGLPIVDSEVFNDIASVVITTNAGSDNLLIIDDISATVVTDPVFNIF